MRTEQAVEQQLAEQVEQEHQELATRPRQVTKNDESMFE